MGDHAAGASSGAFAGGIRGGRQGGIVRGDQNIRDGGEAGGVVCRTGNKIGHDRGGVEDGGEPDAPALRRTVALGDCDDGLKPGRSRGGAARLVRRACRLTWVCHVVAAGMQSEFNAKTQRSRAAKVGIEPYGTSVSYLLVTTHHAGRNTNSSAAL